MPRCPNCGLVALRTKDWACQWCGYPLLSRFYRQIGQTFHELKAARLAGMGSAAVTAQPEPETVVGAEAVTVAEPTVSVDDLHLAFLGQGGAAESRFAGRTVKVSGVVSLVAANDIIGRPCLVLVSGARKGPANQVLCLFPRKYWGALSGLSPGQTVTVRGKYEARTLGLFLLAGCVLVE